MDLSLILLSKLGVPYVSSLTTNQIYASFFMGRAIRKFDEFHIAFIDLCKFLYDVMPGKRFMAPKKEDIEKFYVVTWSKTPEPERKEKFTRFVEENVEELKTDHYRAVIITGMVVPAAAVVLKNTAENIQLVKRFKLHLIPNFLFVPTCTFLALYLIALIVYNRKFKLIRSTTFDTNQLGLPDVSSLTVDQLCERFFQEIQQFDEFHTAFIYLCKFLNYVMPGKRFTAPTKEDIQEFYEDTWSKTLEPKRREKLTPFVTEKLQLVFPAAGGPRHSYNNRHGIITSMVVLAAAVVLKNSAENIQLVKQFKLHLIPNFVFVPTCTFLALYLMALIVYNRRFKSHLGVAFVSSLTTDQFYERFFKKKRIQKFDEFHIAFIDLCKFLNDVMPGKHFTAPTKEDIQRFYDYWREPFEPERREELTAFVTDNVRELKTDDKAVIITGMVVPAAAVVLKNTAENIQLMKRFKLHLIPNFLFVPTCTFLALYLIFKMKLTYRVSIA